MSFFSRLQAAKPDPIFSLNAELKSDPREHKIDLLIGYYKSEDNTIPIFSSVKEAQLRLLSKQKDLNYLPIDGHSGFLNHLKSMLFQGHEELVYGAQSVGGTSALHHIGKLLKLKAQKIAIPDPTWANHRQIFEYLGFEVLSYPYYSHQSNLILFDEFIKYIETLEEESVILLHASCHNPSGVDFSFDQWSIIASICKKKRLFPLFDCAYQGFGQSLEKDILSIQIFAKEVGELFLAYSCSKNFGLYGERTGALFYYSQNKQTRDIIASLTKQSVRATYSNPPRDGALIVDQILGDDHLKKSWLNELNSYQLRIQTLRKIYKQKLQPHCSQDLTYVEKGHGLFIFTGLSDKQVIQLKQEDAIYLSSDGRLNITGLNQSNIDIVIKALSKYL